MGAAPSTALAAGTAALSWPAAGLLGAAPSIALAAGTAVLSLPAAGLLGAGVAIGMALAKTADVVNEALDSVCNAAEAVMDYLRTAASWARKKLKAAAGFVREKVLKLLRCLRGRKEAAAARSEIETAAARKDVKAGLPPPSSTMFSATAPGGALALPASVAAPAARAARRASEMIALLETVEPARGYSIPEAARSRICVVVTTVGIGLEAIAAAAA